MAMNRQTARDKNTYPDDIRKQQTKHTPASNAGQIDKGRRIRSRGKQRKHISALTRGEGDVLRKENPPLYGREGNFDVQIQFGRNKHTLFQLLAGDGVGAITTEDEDLAVTEEFMSH